MTNKVYRWTRPALPDDQAGQGLPLSVVAIVLGFAGMLFAPLIAEQGERDLAAFLAIVSGPLFGAGVFFAGSLLIVREVRQAAFEAAIRAGEAEPVSK